jgi:hypothetical protein
LESPRLLRAKTVDQPRRHASIEPVDQQLGPASNGF